MVDSAFGIVWCGRSNRNENRREPTWRVGSGWWIRAAVDDDRAVANGAAGAGIVRAGRAGLDRCAGARRSERSVSFSGNELCPDHNFVLFLVGRDCTGNALVWCVGHLQRHPLGGAQQRLGNGMEVALGR